MILYPNVSRTCSFLPLLSLCSVAQSCSTLCDPMDCSPPRLLCPWDFPGKNTGAGNLSLLQGIFPTQGLNPGLAPCRWIFLPYEPPGKSNPGPNCHSNVHINLYDKVYIEKEELRKNHSVFNNLLPMYSYTAAGTVFSKGKSNYVISLTSEKSSVALHYF